MLPEEIARSISSIDEPELEIIYSRFCEENGTDKEDAFVYDLYKNKRINTEELKTYQFLKQVEFTALAKVNNSGNPTPAENNVGAKQAEDNFTILESIDQGGMGEILIAQDNELGRTVAYKKIHPHVAETPSYLGRFLMEAQVTAQLQHPNIVPVYEMKVDGNNAAYAMKLIQGKTFKGFDH